eukprot:2521205-Pyramimonas_sp.AAC.1
MEEIFLACPNMDIIALAGTRSTHRKSEEILGRRIAGHQVLEAETGDGPYTNRSTGCAVILHPPFSQKHIRRTWASPPGAYGRAMA